MCGIGGIVGGAPDPAVLDRMARAMAHRGPDGEATWSDERIGLAFRRLAIIDLDDRSMQPMHLGDLHLAFNGEIYNYRELRDELERRGHAFRTEGDAEVLLHAWREWGEDALDRLNGMFAFAVWDSGAGTLTLAVDPFGEKPLYVARDGDRLAFASDVRALLCARPDLGAPDEDAIGTFLALGALPVPPRTCFAGIERVPAAHVLRWRGGSVELARYWRPRAVEVPVDPREAASALRELLLDAVRLRLRSDVPVGTSLSGGVDSSAIVGLSAQLAGDHRRHAFTARFPGFLRDEWRYAEVSAQAAGVVVHHAVEPTADELFDDLETLVRDQEEPFPTTSIYAQWRVMRAAHEAGVTVLLDGQGADELFGGYPGMESVATASAGLRAAIRGAAERPGEAVPIAYALLAGRVPGALARRHRLHGASPYAAPAVARDAANRKPDVGLDDGERHPLRRALLAQSFATSLPHLLRFADRDSMAHSREVRLPFLDRRIAEFALSVPASLLVRDGVRKQILRDAVRGIVPDAILDRRDKIGFETPEAHWFNAPAGRERLAAIVLDRGAPTAGMIDRRAIEADLAARAWRNTEAVWRVASLALWSTEFSRERSRAAAAA
jgi:asparagine synthase (glutamine-hydrolysing)